MSSLHTEITIKPATFDHIPALTDIFVARYHDTTPTSVSQRPPWVEERIEKYRTNPEAGYAFFGPQIAEAKDPAKALFLVAVGPEDQVLGFTAAAAEPEYDGYADIHGLIIAPGYDGQGIASQLENKRQDWAHAIGRILRGQIVRENSRSRDFFGRKGYREVGETVMDCIPFVLVEHTSPLTTLHIQ